MTFRNPECVPGSRSRALELAAAALLMAACVAPNAKQQRAAAKPERSATAQAAGPHAAGPLPGSTLDAPVVLCGPRESYRYVADEFQCPRGGNPLHGKLEDAQQARMGALDHPTNGHIVDVYRVPCPGGNVDVFVDMYGCDEYANQLENSGPSVPVRRLIDRYDQEDYSGVISQCDKSAEELEPDESMYCMVLVPASFFVVGKATAAVGVLHDLCSRLPRPSSLSDARANLVVQVTSAVARTAEKHGDSIGTEEGAQIVSAFARACEVTPEDLERALRNSETL